MTAIVHQAELRPVATRAWACAKALGTFIAAIPPAIGVYMYFDGPTRGEEKALEIVEMFQTPLYAEASAAVSDRVDQVVRRMISATPADCSTDRTEWSDACKASREAYKRAVVEEFEAVMNSPEDRQKFILIATFYMHAMKCMDSGACDAAVMRLHFEKKIGLFWRQTYPYIEQAAERQVEYAQWLRDYCRTGDKCKA